MPSSASLGTSSGTSFAVAGIFRGGSGEARVSREREVFCGTVINIVQKALSLKNISYAIREKPILSAVSFRCTVAERLCIFGENGVGKSTLLKILCGQLQADSGTIERQGHVRFVYVPQEFDPAFKDKTVGDYVRENAGDTLFSKAAALTEQLGFAVGTHQKETCGSLSGGQQKILALGVAFAQNPDFLLLDEPENHLDIVSRTELLELLANFRNGVIFISHDRLIIDAVATKVGELAQGTLHLSEGGYEEYLEMKTRRISGLQREFDTESKRIRQLSATIVILHQKAFRGKEIAAYQRAKEELKQLKDAHKEGRPEEMQTRIRLAQTDRSLHTGKLLCRIKDGAFRYEGSRTRLFSSVNLELRSGMKVVLLGRNGSGKSTFLKCLTDALPLEAGSVSWAPGVAFAYFDQHAEFNPEGNAIAAVSEQLGCSESEAQAALGAMKFDSARMSTATKNLSGGERMRVRFAITFGKKADFILLDEPTNHIDEVTWEILLDACKASKSSMLLVTHDYEFIKAFEPAFFWVLREGKITARHKELDELLDELRT